MCTIRWILGYGFERVARLFRKLDNWILEMRRMRGCSKEYKQYRKSKIRRTREYYFIVSAICRLTLEIRNIENEMMDISTRSCSAPTHKDICRMTRLIRMRDRRFARQNEYKSRHVFIDFGLLQGKWNSVTSDAFIKPGSVSTVPLSAIPKFDKDFESIRIEEGVNRILIDSLPAISLSEKLDSIPKVNVGEDQSVRFILPKKTKHEGEDNEKEKQ